MNHPHVENPYGVCVDEDEPHDHAFDAVCSCCGDEDCDGCSDDFPEPGDIRETGR